MPSAVWELVGIQLPLETRILGLGVLMRPLSRACLEQESREEALPGEGAWGVRALPFPPGGVSLFSCRAGAGEASQEVFHFPADLVFWREGK